jgi:hypothetical protein
MAVNRSVPREAEEVEFRPVPGQEREWAGSTWLARSRLWDALGTYPVAGVIVLLLLLMGLSI